MMVVVVEGQLMSMYHQTPEAQLQKLLKTVDFLISHQDFLPLPDSCLLFNTLSECD